MGVQPTDMMDFKSTLTNTLEMRMIHVHALELPTLVSPSCKLCVPRNTFPKQCLQLEKVKKKLTSSHFRIQTC